MDKKTICVDKDGNEFEVSTDQLQFRPAVYGVIIEDGRILLAKQWDGYDFPGGGVNLGEDLRNAVTREVKEETGLEVNCGELITCETSFFKRLNGKFVQSILIYYLCFVTGGELSKDFLDGEEKNYADMPEWTDLDKIKNIKFYNSVNSLEIIEKAKKIGEVA